MGEMPADVSAEAAPPVEPAADTVSEDAGRERPRRGRDRDRDRARPERREAEPSAGRSSEERFDEQPCRDAAGPACRAAAGARHSGCSHVHRVAAAAPVAPARVEPPKVEPFVLPADDLSKLAEAAGLEWIHSDADKVRSVQQAIADEPAPIPLPREPKPPVVVDEGPLVLVETRKDLSQIKLPFESATTSADTRVSS